MAETAMPRKDMNRIDLTQLIVRDALSEDVAALDAMRPMGWFTPIGCAGRIRSDRDTWPVSWQRKSSAA